jgi:hypothetical protein
MDSRIREIEQWVVEAKTDLGECGREAYLRKLFLLDAEIRAVLKDNKGILPEVVSPRRQAKRVRRFSTPAFAMGGVLGALLLTASTVYLSGLPGFLASRRTPSTPAATSAPALERSANTSLADANLGVPTGPFKLPPGEILLDDNWTPDDPAPVDAGTPSAPARLLANLPDAALTKPAAGSASALKLPAGKTLPVGRNLPAASPAESDATSVVILAALPVAPRKPVASNRSPVSSSSSFGAGGAVISREVSFPTEDDFRNSFAITTTAKIKDKPAAKAGKDAKAGEQKPAGTVDNEKSTKDENVDKLDKDALKESLEKPFTR